uniref:Uncharacterized protein n=1 Tax=Phaeomonas parva TaxID=124430 RepID=A0A7S1TYX7_9STRA|mmetsp:Transcript_24062/g.75749  ORF Transcript_24062/g.75749 Transcript_24062/m.75749 type:complete len:558 (+) Transcript_24062:222-1895(+)
MAASAGGSQLQLPGMMVHTPATMLEPSLQSQARYRKRRSLPPARVNITFEGFEGTEPPPRRTTYSPPSSGEPAFRARWQKALDGGAADLVSRSTPEVGRRPSPRSALDECPRSILSRPVSSHSVRSRPGSGGSRSVLDELREDSVARHRREVEKDRIEARQTWMESEEGREAMQQEAARLREDMPYLKNQIRENMWVLTDVGDDNAGGVGGDGGRDNGDENTSPGAFLADNLTRTSSDGKVVDKMEREKRIAAEAELYILRLEAKAAGQTLEQYLKHHKVDRRKLLGVDDEGNGVYDYSDVEALLKKLRRQWEESSNTVLKVTEGGDDVDEDDASKTEYLGPPSASHALMQALKMGKKLGSKEAMNMRSCSSRRSLSSMTPTPRGGGMITPKSLLSNTRLTPGVLDIDKSQFWDSLDSQSKFVDTGSLVLGDTNELVAPRLEPIPSKGEEPSPADSGWTGLLETGTPASSRRSSYSGPPSRHEDHLPPQAFSPPGSVRGMRRRTSSNSLATSAPSSRPSSRMQTPMSIVVPDKEGGLSRQHSFTSVGSASTHSLLEA